MDKVLLHTIVGIFFLIIGLISAIFSKRFARETVKYYPKFYQRYYDEGVYQIVFLLGGVLFVIVGFLIVFQKIKFM
jgi:uncharacterized membrane protein HdeD (DUF308 family)